MRRSPQELLAVHMQRMELMQVDGIESWLNSGNGGTAVLEQLDGIRCLMDCVLELEGQLQRP